MMMLARQTLLRISLMAALALGLSSRWPHGAGATRSAQERPREWAAGGRASGDEPAIWRDTRLHVEPFFAFTIGDEYSRSLIVGGELRFHFLDWLGIGGWGGYSVGQLEHQPDQGNSGRGVTRPTPTG